jgi:aconitate hydratase
MYRKINEINSILMFRAVNEENGEANNIKNRLTNEWGKVPDIARYYKVRKEMI